MGPCPSQASPALASWGGGWHTRQANHHQGLDLQGAWGCKLIFTLYFLLAQQKGRIFPAAGQGICCCPTRSFKAAKRTQPGKEVPERCSAPGQASEHSPGWGGGLLGPDGCSAPSLIGTKNAKGRGLLQAQIPFHGPAAARPVAGGLVNTAPGTPPPGPRPGPAPQQLEEGQAHSQVARSHQPPCPFDLAGSSCCIPLPESRSQGS